MRTILLLLAILAPLHARARAQAVTAFAAASLTDAMKDLSSLWTNQGHPAPALSFGSSSTLARQIEQGAPADLFASADEQWMDYLDQKGLIATGTRRSLLGNGLVLIVPAAHPVQVAIGPGFDLLALLGPDGRLAVGDPAHVPVGLYAKQALTKLGLWDQIAPRIAATADVRSGMLLVEHGEALAGIVYATDAAVSNRVAIAGTFPEGTHDPVTYPFALTKAGDTPDARAFLAFLASPPAREVWVRRGFKVE